MTLRDIVRLRLANQQITAHPSTTPQGVVGAFGGMQAQDYRGALWAVGLRLPGAVAADIERSVADAAIVRTWAMRGTLHLVASSDVRWMLALLAPRIIAAGAYRRKQLGIDDVALSLSRRLFEDALAHGRLLVRDEAMSLLGDAGVDTTGQRGIHILRHLSLEGVLCPATVVGGRQTFALLDEWVPDAGTMVRGDALAQLACRYFGSHGPATLKDFAWWSGLTVADSRVGVEKAGTRLVSTESGETTYVMAAGSLPSGEPASSVQLLPGFDEYVLGYADRGIVLDAAASRGIIPGGNGVFRPAIIVDGRVVGAWRPGSATRPSAVADLFTGLDPAACAALAGALRTYDAFARGPGASVRPVDPAGIPA